MAIQTGKFIKRSAQREASKSIAEQLAKASAGEQKRKGRAGLFGKIGGFLAGEGLQYLAGLALTGLTGGIVNPVTLKILKTLQKGGKYAKALKTGLKGVGMFAGKAAAHQATTGKWGEGLKTSGQVDEITADSKYGYGREEAKSLSEELSRSRESEQGWGTLAGDVAGAYASDFAGKTLSDVFGKGDLPVMEKIGLSEEAEAFDPLSFSSIDSPRIERESLYDAGVLENPNPPFAQATDEQPWSSTMFQEQGGLIPKYKKGGGIFKRFGKKKKSERDDALVALDAILSGGYEKKEGKHDFPMGYTQSQDFTEEDGKNLFRIISKFSTPEGDRFYPGEAQSRSHSLAQQMAMMDAASRAYHSPADSITTDQLAQLKELGLFEEGGQVPSKAPTVSDYFEMQGVTLGGNNKNSLSEILGRK